LPVTPGLVPPASIAGANKAIRSLAEKTGAEYLDACSLFVDGSGGMIGEYFLPDGVHLNERGYALWSKSMEDHIG
jgi:lysophospholipase L1-like esterase